MSDIELKLVTIQPVTSDAYFYSEVEVKVLRVETGPEYRMPDVPPGVDPQEWMRLELAADKQDEEFEYWEEQGRRYGDMIHGEYS